MALGISYLWIDSLCIFQDDLKDWESEAKLMRDVYRNATFCIAATAAKNSTRGLFRNRNCRSLNPVEVGVTRHIDARNGQTFAPGRYWFMAHPVTPDIAIDSAPLNQRAWVAQERYLSRRTIHFTHNLLFWECCEKFASETHPDKHFSCNCESKSGNPRPLRRLVIDTMFHQRDQTEDTCHSGKDRLTDLRTVDDIYISWNRYRAFYTRCQLTKPSDTLIALQGISSEVGELLSDELVFGLWIGRLIGQLLWYCETPNHGRKYISPSRRTPSWSWANWTCAISSGRELDSYTSDHIHDSVQITKLPKGTKSSENMLHSITMRCRLMPFKSRFSMEHDSFKVPLTFGKIVSWSQRRPHIRLDDTSQTHFEQNIECQLLILRHGEFTEGRLFEGLLVVLCDERTRSYERIGFCYIQDRPPTRLASDVLDHHNTLEDQEIQLI
ncbi:hypothetical protein SNOG_14392 [Parastagonospora nodorum SN15]|nr:hypothetical protein SNOG_14392 [Parastagonospora nodorum SN15]EAT78263.1 hypothetical protein SNOG_14392 [Parastagonospora nodorum SN15]